MVETANKSKSLGSACRQYFSVMFVIQKVSNLSNNYVTFKVNAKLLHNNQMRLENHLETGSSVLGVEIELGFELESVLNCILYSSHVTREK